MCITEAAVQRCSWEKVFWKYTSKFTRERPCRSVTSIKLLCNFIEILLQHRCSPVNLLHFFRTPPKNTSGWLLLFCIKIILHPTNCNIPARQWLWNILHGHLCWHIINKFHLLSVFCMVLTPSYHKKNSDFTTNLLKTWVFLTLLEIYFSTFPGAHLDVTKFKVLLRASVYPKGDPSVRECGYQDTTSRFTRLIPGNVCVQDDDMWWSLCLRNDIVTHPSNYSLPILKKYELFVKLPWNCPKFFWKKPSLKRNI